MEHKPPHGMSMEMLTGLAEFPRLIEAMIAQTEAINALAASNMALVDAMLADEEDGDGKPSQTYLSDPELQ